MTARMGLPEEIGRSVPSENKLDLRLPCGARRKIEPQEERACVVFGVAAWIFQMEVRERKCI